MTERLPRDLHPVAWWCWALGLAVAVSSTTNPWLPLLVVGVTALVVAARRGDHPWSGSYRLYLLLGAVIVVVRVLFRIVFGSGSAGTVVLALPEVPLPGWALGVHLLGPVTLEAVVFALYDGLRLAAIVVCVGAANSLANPKRLLRSMPAALYEIGTALVVAVTALPQLAESVRRVRAAQRLRGGDERARGRLRRVLVPVLEDALERSLTLAAGMDTRGYGRTTALSSARRRVTGVLLLVGLCGLCIGTYAVLDRTAPRILALPMIALGILAALLGLAGAGGRVRRTRYRPDPWLLPEWVVVASGVIAAALAVWVSRGDPLAAYPPLTTWPPLVPLHLAAAAIALAGGLAAPPPRIPDDDGPAIPVVPLRELSGQS